MQQIITAKLKLLTTSEQFRVLRETSLAYCDGLNAVSRYAFSERGLLTVLRMYTVTIAPCIIVRNPMPERAGACREISLVASLS